MKKSEIMKKHIAEYKSIKKASEHGIPGTNRPLHSRGKQMHEDKLAEMKAMPKPNLPKSEPMQKDGATDAFGYPVSSNPLPPPAPNNQGKASAFSSVFKSLKKKSVQKNMDMKNMKKPNLPKSEPMQKDFSDAKAIARVDRAIMSPVNEKDIPPVKHSVKKADKDIKGVHAPSYSNGKDKGRSESGDVVRQASHNKNPMSPSKNKLMGAAKQEHKKVLSEMKAMPKPNLPKSEMQKTDPLTKLPGVMLQKEGDMGDSGSDMGGGAPLIASEDKFGKLKAFLKKCAMGKTLEAAEGAGRGEDQYQGLQHQKGVHTRMSSNGVSSMGTYNRGYHRAQDKSQQLAVNNEGAKKEAHKVLAQQKAMPKPNLPKSEPDKTSGLNTMKPVGNKMGMMKSETAPFKSAKPSHSHEEMLKMPAAHHEKLSREHEHKAYQASTTPQGRDSGEATFHEGMKNMHSAYKGHIETKDKRGKNNQYHARIMLGHAKDWHDRFNKEKSLGSLIKSETMKKHVSEYKKSLK